MPDIFDQIQPGDTPAASGGDVFDRIAPGDNPAIAFAKGVGEELNPVTIAKGINNMVQGLTYNTLDTVKGMAQNNAQAWERTKAAYQRGDYPAMLAHFFNYLAPMGSSVEPITTQIEQGGSVPNALGRSVGLGVQLAAPDTKIPFTGKTIPGMAGELLDKLPESVKTGGMKANPKVADAVNWAQDRGIPVDAGTATQNPWVKNIQAGADHYSPIGAVIEEGAKGETTDALKRVAGELASEANPTAVTPQQAGANTAEIMRGQIRRQDTLADAAYSQLRDIAADPANVRNVQTGTRQVDVIDPKTGMPTGAKKTEPVMEDVPLPVDMRPVKASLRPVYDDIRKLMPIAQQRASTGLLALDNIVNGPDAMGAVEADRNLSAIKAAARGAEPELRTLSQGLAARAVQDLHDAVSEAVSQAQRAPAGVVKYVQQGDKLIAIDANGDEVSQPAAGVQPQQRSMGDDVARDPEAISRQSIVTEPITVYRGENGKNAPAAAGVNHVYVTTDPDLAAAHGNVTAYRIKPGARLYHDPEIEGEFDEQLSGIDSLKRGTSAVVHSRDLIPIDNAKTQTPNVPTPAQQLDAGTDARAAQQGAAPAQPNPPRPGDTSTQIIVPGSGNEYAARYEIRELGDIQPSHNGETFSPNPQYPLRNDRNYNNPANQRKVVDWSTPEGFDPRYHITDNPDAVNGPPVVDSDGNVLGGNGRTMIMQRVYKGNPEGAAAYRAMLEQRAAYFGLNPEDVAKFNQPVLVRVLDDGELASAAQRADAITDFNRTGTAALTPAEQAVADARRVSPDTLEKLSNRLGELGPDATTAQAIEGRAGVDLLHQLISDGVIAPQEAARYASEDALTAAGKQRIQQLLLGRFFRDADQLDSLAPAIRNKVERIAGPLARLEAAGDYALTDHVKSAIDLIETAKAHNQPIEDYLQQSGLFTQQKYSPEAQAIAKGLRDGNPTAIAQQLNLYAEHARYAGSYEGPGMFGEFPEPKNPRGAFNHAFGTQLDENAAAAPPEPPSAPAKPADFDQSFQPTPAPPKKTAPPMGAQIGTPAGREALDALSRGRAATKAKWQTKEVLDSLPNSGDVGYQVYQAATQAKDSGIERLRELAKQAPGGIPQIARGFLEDMIEKATAEGDWRKGQGLFERWNNLGPETKKLLFPNPMQRADLDKFFLIAKKLGEVTNPSQSATVISSLSSFGLLFKHPPTGILYILGGGAISKMLHSPAGVRALTEGMQIPIRQTARATIAANRILRIAGQDARPAQRDNVVSFPGGGTSPSGYSAPTSRAASQ